MGSKVDTQIPSASTRKHSLSDNSQGEDGSVWGEEYGVEDFGPTVPQSSTFISCDQTIVDLLEGRPGQRRSIHRVFSP